MIAIDEDTTLEGRFVVIAGNADALADLLELGVRFADRLGALDAHEDDPGMGRFDGDPPALVNAELAMINQGMRRLSGVPIPIAIDAFGLALHFARIRERSNNN